MFCQYFLQICSVTHKWHRITMWKKTKEEHFLLNQNLNRAPLKPRVNVLPMSYAILTQDGCISRHEFRREPHDLITRVLVRVPSGLQDPDSGKEGHVFPVMSRTSHPISDHATTRICRRRNSAKKQDWLTTVLRAAQRLVNNCFRGCAKTV